MRAFTRHTGLVVPLDRANVDTDQIIPKQYLKSIRRTGFGDNLFDGWRYLDEGDPYKSQNERVINRDFVLNQPRYQGASILVAGENFGCGSSREHAPWAIEEYGFRCLIAPSYADIFFNNCFKNGLLPIVLDKEIVSRIMADAAQAEGYSLTVDLVECRIVLPDGQSLPFTVEPSYRHCLLHGLDDIGVSLEHADAIRAYEQRRAAETPWLFPDLQPG